MGTHSTAARPHNVRLALIGLVLSALVGAGLLAAGPAPAAPAAPQHEGYVARVRAYWTEQRMFAATPLDGLVGSVAATRSTDRTASGDAVQSNSTVRVPRTVGKLFFSDSGADYVCSASAIRTKSRNQVLTAGHCVHTGPHPDDGLLPGLCLLVCAPPHYFANWMFVPRYDNGKKPYGTWVATHRFVSDGWRTHENFTQDQGILTMAPRHGKRLVSVVGGNQVALGKSAKESGVRIWGWPAEAPYDGETAWRCDGTTTRDDSYWHGDAKMACSMTAGSSGGPWILPPGRPGDVGKIFAVTSRGTIAGPQILLAHPLPTSLRWLINRAGG